MLLTASSKLPGADEQFNHCIILYDSVNNSVVRAVNYESQLLFMHHSVRAVPSDMTCKYFNFSFLFAVFPAVHPHSVESAGASVWCWLPESCYLFRRGVLRNASQRRPSSHARPDAECVRKRLFEFVSRLLGYMRDLCSLHQFRIYLLQHIRLSST